MQKRIGELLAERRQAMGASLADVEGATLIRSAYIDAIEKGEYGKIPGKIYVRLYVKSYASFLGMDPQQAAEMLDAEAGGYEDNGNGFGAGLDPSSRRQSQKQRMEKLRRQAARRRTLTTAAAIVVLTAIVLIVYFLAGGRWNATSTPDHQQGIDEPAASGEPDAGGEPTDGLLPDDTGASEAEQQKPHRLSISFTDDCWIRAYADGTKVKEGIFKYGQQVEIEAATGIWVRLGNAGGARLSYNGDDLGSPGSMRKVMDISFPSGYQPF